MKRAAIFLHGNPPKKARIREFVTKDTAVICADGGTFYALAEGLRPEVVIGDFDSLNKTILIELKKEKVPILTFPRKKDETDAELVLAYAVKKGYTDLIVFGWMGTRLDHVLANLMLFAEQKGVQLTIVEPEQTLRLVRSSVAFTGKKGDLVSLIPLAGSAGGVSTTGLKWQLQDEVLKFGKTRGISNVFTGKKATVSLKKGALLVITFTRPL